MQLLPLIDNEFISFERTYDHYPNKNITTFKTALIFKETSRRNFPPSGFLPYIHP